ncbi:uncharacterized protein LOC123032335 [Varanus komodoensis]|uniref:uncharacterized protein LOC123032335 n=1 Tax=Varanus komodoensis TaxID=61221 RepID=UPI001CF7CF74|nr:uncharacterized protein LOC123032335 [Varanus komodoensis]
MRCLTRSLHVPQVHSISTVLLAGAMDAFHMGDIFWVLALIPVLIVLLALCTDCRDPELDTPPVDDYQYKPSTNAHTKTFRVLRRPPSPPWTAIQSQPDPRRGPPYTLTNQSASFIKTEGDNESVPSYENEEQACTMDNEENDIDKYIEVLPDVPLTEQRKEDHASSDSIVEQYENIPESQRHSLGEYVNVLEAEATVLDPCFVNISDRESEDDTPDYENVRPGL